MTDIRTLNGRYEAQQMADELLVAYYAGETPEDPQFHLRKARELLVKAASEMGYYVTRKDNVVQVPIDTRDELDRSA